MPASIINWLNSSREYAQGVAIYEKYGKNESLKRAFKQYNNVWTNETLLAELITIQEAENASKAEKMANPAIIIQHLAKGKDPDKPEIIKFMIKHKGDLYAQVNNLRPKLTLFVSDSKRRLIAREIIELRKKIDAIWVELDYFEANGKLMPKVDTNRSMDILQVSMRLKNLQNYINRDRKAGRNDKVIKWLLEQEQLENICKSKIIDNA